MPRNKQQSLQSVVVESGATVRVGSDLLVNSGDEDQPYVAHVTGIHETKKDQARLKVYWYYFPDDVPRGRQPYHARNEIFKSNHADELSSKSIIWTCTVLSLEKWIAFLNTEANPNGPKPSNGPIQPETFDLEEELAACKTVDVYSKKRPREEEIQAGNEKTVKQEEDESMVDPLNEDDKANAVYICRHEFDAVKSQWKDEEVPVFCLCALPYNPDLDMIQCEGCNEWYHPECIKISDKEIKNVGQGNAWTCPECNKTGTAAGNSPGE